MRKNQIVALCAVLSCAPLASAVVINKTPNVGPLWHPLGLPGYTPIYTNSFVYNGPAEEGDLAELGVYLLVEASNAPTFRLQLLADSNNSPTANILAQSGYVSYNSSTLGLLTQEVTGVTLVPGTRYWVAANTVGGVGSGDYQVGGHNVNSDGIVDDGRFWYSNAGSLSSWDGRNRTPEMAIYVRTSAVPEPTTVPVLGASVVGLLVRNRRSRA